MTSRKIYMKKEQPKVDDIDHIKKRNRRLNKLNTELQKENERLAIENMYLRSQLGKHK